IPYSNISLKQSKSFGIDNISNVLLKITNLALYVAISCIIINKSLETDTVPTSIKMAKVIPIYKVKAKNLSSNYRPISLIQNISKIEAVSVFFFLICNDTLESLDKCESTIGSIPRPLQSR
ncbi:hypothetical protein LSH36_548g02006, partial [Paralvinella palmiformis]